ncbi:hypothetical protein EHS25_003922 [Saitozyma podzolica]|uniref:Uncharacterized protein n=1 Tax=Saitozyma podzolica TaxID=1890683 RepID=A0A427Y3X2_9TREE|nr:hypothetical protein EHS25_003922 [Saitozyma podzolica]
MSTLWYTRPAHVWPEALPIGNGRLGAMVFGGVRRERIQLNEDTLYGGGPYDSANADGAKHLPEIQRLIFEGKYDAAEELGQRSFLGRPRRQPAYQTVGDIYIEMDGVAEVIPEHYRRELSLDKAEVAVEYQAEGAMFRRRYLASPVHQVVAVTITASHPGAVNLNIFSSSPQPRTSVDFETDNSLVMTGHNSPENGLSGKLKFALRCHVTTSDGNVTTVDDQVQVREATDVTILIAIATSFRRYDDVSGDPLQLTLHQIESCQGLGFNNIARDSHACHGELFNRVRLELGRTNQSSKPTDERLRDFAAGVHDPALVALYFQFGRYLLISSSRPGTQPANLQGIWNDSLDPGWGCGFTININTQMNYWPAESTALPETVEPLIAMVKELAETGGKTAQVMYNADGWLCHQNTDVWRASAPNTGARWSFWPVGGAWLCRHLWDRYDYCRDTTYLQVIYPVLAGASKFFLSTMLRDPVSGYMVTNPSSSPENVHGIGGSRSTLCPGPTMDMQILRDLFAHTVEAAELLDEDELLRKDLGALRDQLRPTSVGKDGRINEWPDHLVPSEPEPNHRHTSHLYGLYPSYQITPDHTPELADGCAATLLERGPAETGWAAAWRLNLYARLRRSVEAWGMLQTLLCEMTYPNMFDVHPPLSKAYSLGTFQIDGNLGGAAGICEMLIQSPAGTEDVLLLPALPAQLAEGSIAGIRLRGGWTVDLSWEQAEVRHVLLHAGIAGTRRVSCGVVTRTVTLEAGEHQALIGPSMEHA